MATIDLVAVLRSYVERALASVRGAKVLILDAATTRAVSLALSQTDILGHEVYLTERIEGDRGEQLFHLKAVCFLRPTRENVARIRRELRDPRFGEYHLFFTNRLDDVRLQDLAEADTGERVAAVTEAFGDYEPIEPHHFAVPPPRGAAPLLVPAAWDYAASTDALTRVTDGLASVLLSLRRRFVVRHQRGSEAAARLAAALARVADTDERALFDFRAPPNDPAPLLLILDRRDDPVTPLLTQWTYAAMAHELVGIDGGRVDLGRAPGVAPAFRELVLTPRADAFFDAHARSNFGDVGVAVKALVDEAARSSAAGRAATAPTATVAELRAFVERVGDVTAAQAAAGKHVSLLGELARIVDARGLMALSATEQEIACGGGSAAAHADAVTRALADGRLTDLDRLRLVALYALRHERDGGAHAAAMERRLLDDGAPRRAVAALAALLRSAGAARRVGDLFGDRSLATRLASAAKATLRGVDNVYTQHTPLLAGTLDAALRGRLSAADYPYAGSGVVPAASTGANGGAAAAAAPPPPPKLVVAFIVGGTTYEESAAVAELNAACARGEGPAPGARVVLGGTGVLNSAAFWRLFEEVADAERAHGG